MTTSPKKPAFAFPLRAVHLDFHTMPGIGDVGTTFEPSRFAGTLQATGVQYINLFARCNLGFAYYPTKIGVVHPGLDFDLFGKMIECCQAQGIGVAAYFNVRLDHEHAIRHRDWCRVNKQGQVYDFTKRDHFFREMCLNTGYGNHLKSMIKEIIDLYPVDGIFLDCIAAAPCLGSECVGGAISHGLDPHNEAQATHYATKVVRKFQKDVETLTAECTRELRVVFNGMPFCEQPGHIEIETLPGGGWGYDVLPWQLRYARTLDRPILAMTGRFQEGWGDFGGLLPKESMMYDCYHALAHGASCSIGDHLHPRGHLDAVVYEHIAQIFTKIAALDEWTGGAKTVAEILIIEPALKGYPLTMFDLEPIAGATRMLNELHYQFHVSDGDIDLSPYRVIILPDRAKIGPKLKEKLLNFTSSGGFVISSGHAGLEDDQESFALSGGKFRSGGKEVHDPAYFVPNKEVFPEMSSLPITIYEPGIILLAERDSLVLAQLHQPYFNLHSWDGLHQNLYAPPEKDAGRPVLLRSDQVFHFSFPVFKSYFRHAATAYRQLLARCLTLSIGNPLLRINAPSYVQTVMAKQSERLLVHLISYVPETRGSKIVVEDPMQAPELNLSVRIDGSKIQTVSIAGHADKIPFRIDNNYLEFTTPPFAGYQLIVIE